VIEVIQLVILIPDKKTNVLGISHASTLGNTSSSVAKLRFFFYVDRFLLLLFQHTYISVIVTFALLDGKLIQTKYCSRAALRVRRLSNNVCLNDNRTNAKCLIYMYALFLTPTIQRFVVVVLFVSKLVMLIRFLNDCISFR